MGLATDLIYIVISALLGGFLAHLLGQPLIFGYIFAGLIVGPHTGGLTVEHIHDIEMLAEIGVALLLFTLGLEFSFGELKRLYRVTAFAAPLQVLLCWLFGFLVARFFDVGHIEALWIGAAISLSSTMVVLKTLIARDGQSSRAGRVMLAILISQDLAVIPLTLLLPQLSGETFNFSQIGFAVLKSAVFLIVSYIAGTRILPRVFGLVARQGSRELFFLTTLGFALGAGFISHSLGLSFALGAFVAGILLSETDFNHQALSDVAGLRDLFALIFFVSIGMLFDPVFFSENVVKIVFLALAVLVGKSLLTGVILQVFGENKVVGWTAGIAVAQAGEFAFVIANSGHRSGFLSSDSFMLIISVTVLSMIATPILFWVGHLLAAKFSESQPFSNDDVDSTPLNDHVVIVGGGVVGQYVAQVLATLEHPYIVIESDHKTATVIRDQRMAVVFGDGTRHQILRTARVDVARLIVIATTNDQILPLIISEIKELNPTAPIVVRVEEIEDVAALTSLKVHELVQPQLEVGLEMVRQALLALKIEDAQIFTLLGQLRREGYLPDNSLREKRAPQNPLLDVTKLLEFTWYKVDNMCPFAATSLEQARIREHFGFTVVAVVRAEEVFLTPRPDFIIQNSDFLGILGTKTQLDLLRSTNNIL